jgi:hypothetical protein
VFTALLLVRTIARNPSCHFAILILMSNKKPDWLRSAQDFCKSAGIEICAWGADALVVKVEGEEYAEHVVAQLRPLGFEPIRDEDDSQAGLLTMVRDPAATRTRQNSHIASTDASRRPKA